MLGSIVREFFGLNPVPTYYESEPIVATDPTFVPGFNLASCPYTEDELKTTFALIRNIDHWKSSTDVLIPVYQQERAVYAIRAFHGVEPVITKMGGSVVNVFSCGWVSE